MTWLRPAPESFSLFQRDEKPTMRQWANLKAVEYGSVLTTAHTEGMATPSSIWSESTWQHRLR